jgi:hypothetical protein
VELVRYRNSAFVFFFIGLAMLTLDRGLHLALGDAPTWLVPEQIPIGWDAVDCTERRFAALMEEREWEAQELDQPLCLYFGLSTGRLGIDPDVLATQTADRMRFVGFCGNGASVEHLVGMARPWLRSDYSPDLAILALHPSWLAGRRSEGLQVPPTAAGGWKTELKNQLRATAQESWIVAHRTFVNHFFRSCLYSIREKLFVELKLPPKAFSAADPDPWQPMRPTYYTEARDPSFIPTQLDRWESFGWFDRDSYTNPTNKNPQTLLNLLANCHDRGTQVIIVMMPESSVFRERLPPEARELLLKTIRESEYAANVTTWDLQNSMDDGLFRDTIHLGLEGREKLSRKLAELIDSLSPSTTRH